jgi:hypothetical protein
MPVVTAARRAVTGTGLTGIAYALSWIAGLAVPAPSLSLSASGAAITAALAGHGTAVAAQFALTEGLPAAGLAVVSVALARAARRSGARAAGSSWRPAWARRSSRWPSSCSGWPWPARPAPAPRTPCTAR